MLAGRALLLAAGILPAQDAVPARIPVTLTPEEFRFFACAGRPGAEGEHLRTFFLLQKPGSPGTVDYPGVAFVTDQAADWSSSSGQVANGELQISVAFRPQAARSSTATLKIQVDYPLGTGRVTETITLALEGRGVACAPAAPPTTEEPVPRLADIELCLKFHLVEWTAPPPRPSEADFDAWVAEANRIFAGSGVRFRRAAPVRAVPAAPRIGEPELAEEDPHCLDVYVLDEIAGSTRGDSDVRLPDSEEWRAMLRELGIDPDSPLGRNMGAGRRCRVETGEHAGRTLAHELGHMLGLGAGPDPVHRDPETGADIEDEGRLMHATPEDARLTDSERRIARRLAQWIEDHRSPCGSSQQIVPSPRSEQLDPRGDLRFATLVAREQELVFTAFLAAPFTPAATLPELTLELDSNLDGAADSSVSTQFAEGRWFLEQQPTAGRSAPVPPPEALFEVHLPAPVPERAAGALQLRVPRAFLARPYGELGWRLRLAQGALASSDAVPAQGFRSFDTTVPAFAIALDPDSRQLRASPIAAVALSGTLYATATFDGSVEFSARLWTADGILRLPLASLDQPPSPTSWSFPLALPATDLPESTLLSVVARCAACQRVSSDVATLEWTGGGGLPLAALFLVAVLLAGLALLLMGRRNAARRPGSAPA